MFLSRELTSLLYLILGPINQLGNVVHSAIRKQNFFLSSSGIIILICQYTFLLRASFYFSPAEKFRLLYLKSRKLCYDQ